MNPEYTLVGINDEADTCACCGKTGLKRVAWLLAEGADEPDPFGTTCAAHALRGREGAKPRYGAATKQLERALEEALRTAAARMVAEADFPEVTQNVNSYGVPVMVCGHASYAFTRGTTDQRRAEDGARASWLALTHPDVDLLLRRRVASSVSELARALQNALSHQARERHSQA